MNGHAVHTAIPAAATGIASTIAGRGTRRLARARIPGPQSTQEVRAPDTRASTMPDSVDLGDWESHPPEQRHPAKEDGAAEKHPPREIGRTRQDQHQQDREHHRGHAVQDSRAPQEEDRRRDSRPRATTARIRRKYSPLMPPATAQPPSRRDARQTYSGERTRTSDTRIMIPLL